MDKGLEIDKELLDESRKRENASPDDDVEDIEKYTPPGENKVVTDPKAKRNLDKRIQYSHKCEARWARFVIKEIKPGVHEGYPDGLLYAEIQLYVTEKGMQPITCFVSLSLETMASMMDDYDSQLDAIIKGIEVVDLADDGRMYG